MSDSGDRVDVRDIAVGIAEGLEIYGSGVILDRSFNFREIVRVNECGGDAVQGKCVREQVVAAAVDGLLGYDVAAVGRKSLNGVCDRSRARCQRESGAAAFESRESLFETS